MRTEAFTLNLGLDGLPPAQSLEIFIDFTATRNELYIDNIDWSMPDSRVKQRANWIYDCPHLFYQLWTALNDRLADERTADRDAAEDRALQASREDRRATA